MRDLTVRLAALDPEAGAAIRVVSYFDELAAGHAGLHAVVRGAAALTGCGAGLSDDRRNVHVRVDPEGRPAPRCVPDPGWLHHAVDGGATLWLERPGPARVVDAVVLERASALALAVLERTRPITGGPVPPDPALLEVLLDPAACPPDRRRAGQALGCPDTVRVAALSDGSALLVGDHLDLSAVRAGVGPRVDVADAPASHAAARAALRLTAEGTPADPGPRVVHAEAVPALLLLAGAVDGRTPPNADVRAVDRCAAAGPAMLQTLHVLTTSTTQRAAATTLGLHHSTLQKRLATASRLLGWDLHTPDGVHRLHLALAVRRLHRNPR
ncbi:helix-turn-helix domain-containing protein [Kineococcus rhizosphaerae]|uniref:PucR-like helix-turn-helix protein n=1 Tax=Kineococcus rhizosphaerae TaxID=559628 RepID=A0A2T0R082_9ACTN|nr:helix-turn-helix domain-containing protein [Kineococcus rhizosphaerae]PRY12552.1 PucR-like helix-turn-helix protein [Kineococcus rhizosphaerae]